VGFSFGLMRFFFDLITNCGKTSTDTVTDGVIRIFRFFFISFIGGTTGYFYKTKKRRE
jgi:hypothetical protein